MARYLVANYASFPQPAAHAVSQFRYYAVTPKMSKLPGHSLYRSPISPVQPVWRPFGLFELLGPSVYAQLQPYCPAISFADA